MRAIRRLLRRISPDGKTVAAGGYNNLVRLWDVATGALFGKLEHSDRCGPSCSRLTARSSPRAPDDDTVKLSGRDGASAGQTQAH